MSMMGGAPAEHGERVGDYASYPAAQKAVSRLIEADIPAKDIAIVGRGLRSVETITGRLGYAAAARSGAINGILLGLLFSALFVLGTPGAAVQLFAGVMLVGIAVGMLMSLIVYSFLRRKRDYSSITQLVADHYEVTVLPRSIHRAREVVGGRSGEPASAAPTSAPVLPPPGAVAPPAAPPIDAEPPRYGERIDPTPGANPPAP